MTYPGGGYGSTAAGSCCTTRPPRRERVLADGFLPAIWRIDLGVYARADGLHARVDGRERRIDDGGGRDTERSGIDVYGAHVAAAQEEDTRTRPS